MSRIVKVQRDLLSIPLNPTDGLFSGRKDKPDPPIRLFSFPAEILNSIIRTAF